MSTTAQWLARLNRATDYIDLQAMFQELLADLEAGTPHAELATALDEAIRRLEIERARDTHELESFTQEFNEFREQQRGVIGWFRRHLPFSPTKRQEREHRESIADQHAELLADNLIIARAQMVKEYLLPPEQRKMGCTAETWQRRIQAVPAPAALPMYAEQVRTLNDEIERSQAFLQLLADDVEAFAKADFAAAADEQRQRVDLTAARRELAALQAELEQEVGLRATGLRSLGELVAADLAAADPEYRRRADLVQKLGVVRERGTAVHTAAAQVLAQLQRLVGLEQERFELPRLLQQMEQEAQRYRAQAEEARSRHSRLNLQLGQQSRQVEVAQNGLAQARAAFDAARRIYEAFVRDQGVVELDPRTQASPVYGEYQRQEQAFRVAESSFQQIAAPFQKLQIEVGDLGRLGEILARNVEEILRRQQGNTRRQREVQESLGSEYQRVRPLFERLRMQLAEYEQALYALGRTTRLPSLDRFHDLTPLGRGRSGNFPGTDWQALRPSEATQENYELIQRFQTGLERELEQLGEELGETQTAQHTAWAARVHELLSEPLAAAVIGQVS